LKEFNYRIEQTADGLLKVYLPQHADSQDMFKAALDEKVQIRHFVKSETSLEDRFAQAVGVD